MVKLIKTTKKQLKKLPAFTLAGTLTLLVFLSILFVAIIPTITKRMANISTNYGTTTLGGTKGRYEVWRAVVENNKADIDFDGNYENIKNYLPKGTTKSIAQYIDKDHDNTIILEKYCGRYKCSKPVICDLTGCKFNPPADAHNFKIYAVGGGGAGGSSGSDALNNMPGTKNNEITTVGLTNLYDSNKEGEYFSVVPKGSIPVTTSPNGKTTYNNYDYINTFPHQKYRKTTKLGSTTQKAQYEDMKPWFNFDTLLANKSSKYVIGVACGGSGTKGQDLIIKTKQDEAILQAQNECSLSENSCSTDRRFTCSSYDVKVEKTCTRQVQIECLGLPARNKSTGKISATQTQAGECYKEETYDCSYSEHRVKLGTNRTCGYNCSCYTGLYTRKKTSKNVSVNNCSGSSIPDPANLIKAGNDICEWKNNEYKAVLQAGSGGSAASCVYVKTKINHFLYANISESSDSCISPTIPLSKYTTQ